jgi:hypothetical protein
MELGVSPEAFYPRPAAATKPGKIFSVGELRVGSRRFDKISELLSRRQVYSRALFLIAPSKAAFFRLSTWVAESERLTRELGGFVPDSIK